MYIPPVVDELTDEEDIDDNVVIEQVRPNEQEISGLFEIQNHNDTTNEGPIDSDDETLDVKRQKLLRQKVSAPVWKKGETTYANLPVFDNTGREDIKNNLCGKSPLELFYLFFDEVRLMKAEDDNRNRKINQAVGSSIPDEVRLDNIGHVISMHADKARRRCKLCKSHTIYICVKCKTHLHLKCFEAYHKKI